MNILKFSYFMFYSSSLKGSRSSIYKILLKITKLSELIIDNPYSYLYPFSTFYVVRLFIIFF